MKVLEGEVEGKAEADLLSLDEITLDQKEASEQICHDPFMRQTAPSVVPIQTVATSEKAAATGSKDDGKRFADASFFVGRS